jgi:hypothetical protein
MLTFMNVSASIVYEVSRILNGSFPYFFEEVLVAQRIVVIGAFDLSRESVTNLRRPPG